MKSLINTTSSKFSKTKLASLPFATLYYSHVIKYLQIYVPLFQFIYNFDLQIPTPWKVTWKLQKIIPALLVMLVTFRMFEVVLIH